MRRQQEAPHNRPELHQSLVQELKSIIQVFIQNYVLSMRQSLKLEVVTPGINRIPVATNDKMLSSCDFIFLLL